MPDTLEILLTASECLSIAQGRRLQCTLSDGQKVWIRLPTEDEARQAVIEARNRLMEKGQVLPEFPSQAHFADMARPLDLGET